MVRTSIIYLLASILFVIFASKIKVVLLYYYMVYTNLNFNLSQIFNSTHKGEIIRKTLLLLILPIIISGVPAIAYKLIKKHTMPYLIEATWFLWLILVLATILIQ